MPVTYRIDVAAGIVYSEAHGRVTDDDLVDHQSRLQSDPDFRPDLRQLFDFRGVEAVEVTTHGIRRLAERQRFGPGSKRAFVTSREVVYGLARMYQAMTDPAPGLVEIFRDDMDQARKWLGC